MQMEAKLRLDHQSPVAACQVTYTGTELHLPESGISLIIPPGAVPEGKSFEVHLSLSLDDDYPQLEEGHTLICPIVRCQPYGICFSLAAILTLPCNAVNEDEDEVEITVWQSKSSGMKKYTLLR